MVNLAFPPARRRERDHGAVKYNLTHIQRPAGFSHGFKLLCPPRGEMAKHPWQNDTTSCLSSSITPSHPPRPKHTAEALLNVNHPEVSPGRQAERWDCLGEWLPKFWWYQPYKQSVQVLFILMCMLWLSSCSGSPARSGRLVKMDAAWPSRPSDAATLWTSVA